MEDVLSYAFALAVIFVTYKWFTSAAGTPNPSGPSLGFTPKRVTQEMVTQVQTMFPDQPYDNIQFDLLRTGSVELTCNKILEQGFLPPPPPAYFTLYPTQAPTTPAAPRATGLPTQPTSPTAPSSKQQSSLIDRYGLKERLESPGTVKPSEPEKTVWETTAEKREASLKERKAKMVLAARQRLLEKEKQSSTSQS